MDQHLLTRRELWTRLLLYPTHTLPTAAAPVAVGVGLAIHDGVFAPLPALLGFVASWLIHVGGVFLDNYELLRRHAELPEHPELTAALRAGTLRLSHLRAATIACFALAIVPGPYLLAVGGTPVVALGVIGIVASVGYAGGPRPYAALGLAEPIFFLMFGVVAVAGTYYIQAAAHGLPSMPWTAWVAGLPVGALVTDVLMIDDIRDRGFDELKRWRTTAVRFGVGASRSVMFALTAFAYVAVPLLGWLGGLGPWVLLTWLTAPGAYGVLRALGAHRERDELHPLTPRMAIVSMLFGVLFGIGIAIWPG